MKSLLLLNDLSYLMEICLLLCSGEDVEYSFSKYKNLGFVKSQVTFWNVMR
jgi:hypothetical protein